MPAIVITGANRGIGLELARQATARGDEVIAACRDPGSATELQELAAKSGSKVRVVQCDVASAASVTAFKKAIGNMPVDVLINNAGIMGADPQNPLAMDFDVLSTVMDVNLHGPLRVTQALADNVSSAKGKIAVISSMMGQYNFGGTNKLAYCVSKTAVTRAFHMLASDVRNKGVTVAILSPGWVKTDMGGSSAPVRADVCARGLLQQIAQWKLADSGAFRDFEGRELEW
jgi:NAD(P)-dependent dehydrogenase (short-subunit alcohol dehydrogenase family)